MIFVEVKSRKADREILNRAEIELGPGVRLEIRIRGWRGGPRLLRRGFPRNPALRIRKLRRNEDRLQLFQRRETAEPVHRQVVDTLRVARQADSIALNGQGSRRP